jgi:4-amino-4-deoxy-L-arabinose transferase-like glycosyltransferase
MAKSYRVWGPILLVFCVAFALRIVFLAEASSKPGFDLVYMDSEYNLEWARALATGIWNPPYDRLHKGPYFRAPLYPMFLGGLLKISGGNLWFARSFQAILGSFSCVLAFLLARRCHGTRVGLVTGLLCAGYWVLIYFDSQFLLPVLLVFLALAGFYLLSLSLDRRSLPLAGLSGMILGLFAITRPNILAFFPFLVVWGLWAVPGTWRRRLLFAALLAAGAGLPPLAATVRNRVAGGDWVLVASQGGVNFFIGNNPQSNGMQAVVPGTRATWWGGYEDTVAIAEQSQGRTLRPSEVSSYWYGRAFKFIRNHPAAWLELTLRKSVALIGDVEIPNNAPYQARRGEYFTLSVVPLGFGFLMALFAVGLPWLVPRSSGPGDIEPRRALVVLILIFMAVYSATIVAFFVTGRYRVTLVPFVAMGSAVGLVHGFDYLKARRWRQAGLMGAAALLLFGLLRMDVLNVKGETAAFVRLTVAQDHLQLGRLDEAIAELEQIRRTQMLAAPEVYITLARAHLQRGRLADRAAVLSVAEEGLRHHPATPELLWYAAVGQVEQRKWPEARHWIEQYLKLEPEDVRALHLACLVAINQQRRAEAEAALRRAEQLDPDHPTVRDMQRMLK